MEGATVQAPPDTAPGTVPVDTSPADATSANAGPEYAESDEHVDARLIRPYAMTGGRTKTSANLTLEAQIQTSTRHERDSATYRWEAATILQLAERPMALVELAARAEIPIGVARVVVSDLVEAGAVIVQQNAPVTSYTSLLEKVLDGIRDL